MGIMYLEIKNTVFLEFLSSGRFTIEGRSHWRSIEQKAPLYALGWNSRNEKHIQTSTIDQNPHQQANDPEGGEIVKKVYIFGFG